MSIIAEERKTDRRIRKTKLAVHNALLELMQERELSEITVSELTRRADINRKTFYNHYSDIFEVLEELEDECVRHIIEVIDVPDLRNHVDDPTPFFMRFIEELQNNGDFYRTLYRSREHYRLVGKLVQKEKEMLSYLVSSDGISEVWLDYYLNFIAYGTLSVISSWFQEGEKIPIEMLAQFFNALFSSSDTRAVISKLPVLEE